MKRALTIVLWLLLFCQTALLARNPVIFVHGLSSDAATWSDVAHYLRSVGWKYGGELVADRATGKTRQPVLTTYGNIVLPEAIAADFYLMDFSDYLAVFPSQNLSLAEQGEELKLIVDYVLGLTGKPQVILVGHSMGGLAVRAYLEYQHPAAVEQAILVATPNLGSETAAAGETAIGRLALFFPRGIRPESRAVQLLRPDSEELAQLNNFARYRLPANTRLACVIIEGGDIAGLPPDEIENDGLVNVASQDLSRLAGAAVATPQEIYRFVFRLASDPILFTTAHSEAIHDDRVIKTLAEILNQTFPLASVDKHLVGAGEKIKIELQRAPLGESIRAAVWKDDRRIADNVELGQYVDGNGQRLVVGQMPAGATGSYSLRLEISGRFSNQIRVTTRQEVLPVLELTFLGRGPNGNVVQVQVHKAKPGSEVKLALTFESGKTLLLTGLAADQRGEWQTIISVTANERFVLGQAEAAGFVSAQVRINLPIVRDLYLFDGGSGQILASLGLGLDGVTFDSRATRELLGQNRTGAFRFSKPVVFFRARVQANTALTVSISATGKSYDFLSIAPGNTFSEFTIRDPSGITEVRLRAAASGGPPFWRMNYLLATSDDGPLLMSAGFSPDPIPKSTAKSDEYWHTWVFLEQLYEALPIEIENLEFAFFDQNGQYLYTQSLPAAELYQAGWFALQLFSSSPLDLCAPLAPDPSGRMMFQGPGRICQELVYQLIQTPIEPRYVALRFLVKDIFGNSQTVSHDTLMLAK